MWDLKLPGLFLLLQFKNLWPFASEESMLRGCWVVGLHLTGHHLSWWSGLIMRHCGQGDSCYSALMHLILKCPVPMQYISPQVLLFICILNSISSLDTVQKFKSAYFNIQHLNICLHLLAFFWAHVRTDLTGAPADTLATYLNTKPWVFSFSSLDTDIWLFPSN